MGFGQFFRVDFAGCFALAFFLSPVRRPSSTHSVGGDGQLWLATNKARQTQVGPDQPRAQDLSFIPPN